MELKVKSIMKEVPATDVNGFHYNAYQKEVYGFITEEGEWAIEPSYDYAAEFSEGLAFVKAEKENGCASGYIDKANHVVIDLGVNQVAKAGSFKHNLALIQKKSNLKWAIIDRTGKLLTDYEFEKPTQVQISKLKTLCGAVLQYGAEVLHYADPELLVTNESMDLIKKAIKNHIILKNPEELSNKELTEIVNYQKETMNKIRSSKLLSICPEIKGGSASKIDKMLDI